MTTAIVGIPLDWLAGATALVANWRIGKKDKVGWLLNLTAQIPLLYINYKFKLWGLFPMSFVLMAINVRNYLKWLKEDVDNEHGTKGDRRRRDSSGVPQELPGDTNAVEGPDGFPYIDTQSIGQRYRGKHK